MTGDRLPKFLLRVPDDDAEAGCHTEVLQWYPTSVTTAAKANGRCILPANSLLLRAESDPALRVLLRMQHVDPDAPRAVWARVAPFTWRAFRDVPAARSAVEVAGGAAAGAAAAAGGGGGGGGGGAH